MSLYERRFRFSFYTRRARLQACPPSDVDSAFRAVVFELRGSRPSNYVPRRVWATWGLVVGAHPSHQAHKEYSSYARFHEAKRLEVLCCVLCAHLESKERPYRVCTSFCSSSYRAVRECYSSSITPIFFWESPIMRILKFCS